MVKVIATARSAAKAKITRLNRFPKFFMRTLPGKLAILRWAKAIAQGAI
jgi:hypothetical protein